MSYRMIEVFWSCTVLMLRLLDSCAVPASILIYVSSHIYRLELQDIRHRHLLYTDPDAKGIGPSMDIRDLMSDKIRFRVTQHIPGTD